MSGKISTTQSRILFRFSDLVFQSDKHWYFLDGEYLPSVTGLIKRHYPAFDGNKMVLTKDGYKSIAQLSAAKASREGGKEVTEHELKRKWQLINTTACNLGTKTHKFMENFTGIETPTTPQEEAGVKYIKSLEGEYRISFRELRAYSRKYKYAGTMDLPLEVIGSKREEFVIDDYKTNGDLFKAYDYMYSPFETLESSAYNHIQLQLSYYQIMLEEVGLYISNRRLVHLKADSEFRIFPLIDFTRELKDYMKHIVKYN